MISVKICGITNPADAEMCVKAGARALGFVFYGLSPRAVSPAQVRESIAAVPASIKKVGVFVNQKKESVLELAQKLGLDMVQLSGDELVVDCQWLTAKGVKVVKAVRPRTSRDVKKLADYRDAVFAFNIDAFKEGEYGGTGNLSEWALAREAKEFGRPIILAGGLTGGNVLAAIKAVEPAALDVCSGVEREPGRKDAKKLKGLFEALWRYDEELRKALPPAAAASLSNVDPKSGGISAYFEKGASGPVALPVEKGKSGTVPIASLPPAGPPPKTHAPLPVARPAHVIEPAKPALSKVEGPDAPAPAAAASGSEVGEESGLVDRALGPDPNDSGAFLKNKEEQDKEESPLVDWASASSAVKKPEKPKYGSQNWPPRPPDPKK